MNYSPEQLVNNFNIQHPVGTSVLYRQTETDDYTTHIIVSNAFVQVGNYPMIELEGVGSALLSKVEPILLSANK